MSHPDNPFGEFKNDQLRFEAIKVDAHRQIVLSLMDKTVSFAVLIVFSLVVWLAPDKIPMTLGAGGLAKGLSMFLKR